MICLEGFMHFIKIFKICETKQDLYKLIQKFEDKIRIPIDDTLNIKNGINFAQFLEAILQTAYFKVSDAERT